ncbi:hypothetical protein B0H19DRAFT_1098298 [Mycena capillaripes]|nr:hypothetical protein B0H19DRAFT_1098298 [Mycena capillaripes]
MASQALETPGSKASKDATLPTASERTALAADRTRIADIETQIREFLGLNHSVKSLEAERNLLQKRLDTYRYPVLTLPTEIVSEIFIHFLPVYPKCPSQLGPLSPYMLCQICRTWRNIAVATPELWRAISVSLRKPKRSQQKLRLLENSLERSGSCLLSIQLRGDRVEEPNLTQFSQTIADHCDRWEHLEICVRHPFDVLPDAKLRLPKLRSMRFRENFIAPYRPNLATAATFLGAPLLAKFALGGYHGGYGLIFRWSQLTVLSVDWIHINDSIGLLNQLANVSYCAFTIFGIDNGQPSLRDLTLPYLETFILDAIGVQSVRESIPDRLTLPALQRFRVTENVLDPDPIATLVSLVSRSGCSLHMLCVPSARIPRRRYQQALPSVSSLTFSNQLDMRDPFLKQSDDDEDWAEG